MTEYIYNNCRYTVRHYSNLPAINDHCWIQRLVLLNKSVKECNRSHPLLVYCTRTHSILARSTLSPISSGRVGSTSRSQGQGTYFDLVIYQPYKESLQTAGAKQDEDVDTVFRNPRFRFSHNFLLPRPRPDS